MAYLIENRDRFEPLRERPSPRVSAIERRRPSKGSQVQVIRRALAWWVRGGVERRRAA